MTLAWTLFAFVGLFTARYMRQVWEPTELLGKKAWFTVGIKIHTQKLLVEFKLKRCVNFDEYFGLFLTIS